MAFSFKRTITIDETLCGTADSTNYPLGFFGTYDGTGGEPDLRSTGNGGKVAQANGYDIAFYSDSDLTTILDYERVSWSATTGAIEFWIRIPTLSTSADTVIYMAYGDSGASDLQDQANTWNANFLHVCHLEDATTSTVAASTTAGLSGAKTSANNPLVATSIVGNGQNYSSDNITFANANASYDLTSTHTFEFWVKLASTDQSGAYVFTRNASGGEQYSCIYGYNSGKFEFYSDKGGSRTALTTVVNETSNYHYIAWTFETGVAIIGYLEGVSDVNNGTTGTLTSITNGTLYLGNSSSSGNPINGIFDELRVSNVARPASYFTATNNNITVPGTFYSIGSETAVGGGSAFIPKILII